MPGSIAVFLTYVYPRWFFPDYTTTPNMSDGRPMDTGKHCF